MIYKTLNKFQLAKIITSSLYNMDYVCTTLNKVQWEESIKRARIRTREELVFEYGVALDALNSRGVDIEEWRRQSIEGEQNK